MTTYLTATQAATRLGKSEKTIRRWIKEKRLVAHHPQGRANMLAIAESDIDQLALELAQYEQQSESDQTPDTGSLESLESRIAALEQQLPGDTSLTLATRIAALESRLTAIEQKLASIEPPAQAAAATTQPATRTLHPTRAVYATTERPGTQETPVDIPSGSLEYWQFAINHSVNKNTFRDHVTKGFVPSIARPKPNRPGQVERWLTLEQQLQALAFWQNNGTAYATCDNPVCPCHSSLPDSSKEELNT